MPKAKEENTGSRFDSRWVWVRAYGAKLRRLGEQLETCVPELDDFDLTIREMNETAEKIAKQIREIKGQ